MNQTLTLSFLIASPMINEVAVIVLASVIGWKMTLLYVIAGLSDSTERGAKYRSSHIYAQARDRYVYLNFQQLR